MRLSKADAGVLLREVGTAVLLGALAAFLVPADAMARIDDMMVTFLSIILAAVIPGVALTTAASRPPVETPLEAQTLGSSLEGQVRFWFGFLLFGGLSVFFVLIGSALDWELTTPRPDGLPQWVPDGSAWLVFSAVSSASFTVIRARHVAKAIIDLIKLGTKAHADQARERRRQLQAEVSEALRTLPTVEGRGETIENRDRRPRH